MNQRSANILLALALATGCKNGGVVANPADIWLIAPDGTTNIATQMSANLGDSCVGLPKDVTYTFELSTIAVVTVSPSSITTDSPEFKVIDPLPDASAFDIPGSQVLTVEFKPSATGARSGTLNVAKTQDATNTPLTIQLSGTGDNGYPVPAFDTSCPLPGAGPGQFPLTPCDSLTFLNVYFNTKQDIPVTLFNDGGCPPFIVDSATLVYDGGAFSDGGGPFNVVATFPQSVALSSQPYSLVVEYSPTPPTGSATSTTDEVTLNIHTTNGFYGDAGTWPVKVHGTGVAPLVSLVGPDGSGCNKFARPLDPNGFAYQREAVQLTFTITNGAQATPVVVGQAFLDAGNTGFTIVPGTCWAAGAGAVLPDGGISLPTKNSSATCDVQFDPENATSDGGKYPTNGAFFDYLEAPYIALEPDGGQPGLAEVCLHATAEPVVCVAPGTTIQLPDVTYCGFVPQDIKFRNCGSVDLVVNDIFLGSQTISSWSLFKGSAFPTTLLWSDPPITSTIVYSDDGGTNNPSTTVIMSAKVTGAGSPDGGTTVIVNASAWGLNPPPDLLVPAFSNGGGRWPLSGSTYTVDMPIPIGPTPYNMNWYYTFMGVAVDAGELITDGGYHAWLTPNSGSYGLFRVCANVVEAPLPDGGGTCNASVDGGGNCTNPGLTTF